MNPRDTTDRDLDYWYDRNPKTARFTGPGETDDGIEPCPGLILTDNEIAVPWTLNEIEMMHLVKGGTLWLVTRGGLPIHGLHVQEPA
jgi:hypothetical protein